MSTLVLFSFSFSLLVSVSSSRSDYPSRLLPSHSWPLFFFPQLSLILSPKVHLTSPSWCSTRRGQNFQLVTIFLFISLSLSLGSAKQMEKQSEPLDSLYWEQIRINLVSEWVSMSNAQCDQFTVLRFFNTLRGERGKGEQMEKALILIYFYQAQLFLQSELFRWR